MHGVRSTPHSGSMQEFWTTTKIDFESPQHVNLMLNPDFQPCPPFQSAVTEEFIKWVWLGLKTVISVKIIVKIQEKKLIQVKFLHLWPKGWPRW